MRARRCEMPAECAFSRNPGGFHYVDSFEMPLRRQDLTLQQIYVAIFARHPRLFDHLLVLRGKIVSLFGLRGTTAAQLKNMVIKDRYKVGERILRFNLYAESDNEIIAGGDDKHLDFRVSLLRLDSRIVLSTAVTTHNRFGRIYISLIAPFHRFGVMTIMSNAIAMGRL